MPRAAELQCALMVVERAPELEDLLRDAYEAHQRGDGEPFARLVSRDPATAAFGSDPTERSEGPDAFAEMLRLNVAGRSDAPPLATLQDVVAYRAGDVGWAVCGITFTHPSGRGDAPFRGTAVLLREDGEWKIVQWTVAALVPDETMLRDDWPVHAG